MRINCTKYIDELTKESVADDEGVDYSDMIRWLNKPVLVKQNVM